MHFTTRKKFLKCMCIIFINLKNTNFFVMNRFILIINFIDILDKNKYFDEEF